MGVLHGWSHFQSPTAMKKTNGNRGVNQTFPGIKKAVYYLIFDNISTSFSHLPLLMTAAKQLWDKLLTICNKFGGIIIVITWY